MHENADLTETEQVSNKQDKKQTFTVRNRDKLFCEVFFIQKVHH